jgi:peptide/nickel transport system ATP-binding protein
VVGKPAQRLYSIPGSVPNPIDLPDICYFRERCFRCQGGCAGAYPPEIALSPTHKVSCYYPQEGFYGRDPQS